MAKRSSQMIRVTISCSYYLRLKSSYLNGPVGRKHNEICWFKRLYGL